MSSNELLKESVQGLFKEADSHLKGELGPDYKRLRRDLPLYEELLKARIENQVLHKALKLSRVSERVVDNVTQMLFTVEALKDAVADRSVLKARLAEVEDVLRHVATKRRVFHVEQRVDRVDRDQDWIQTCKELGREDLLNREAGR